LTGGDGVHGGVKFYRGAAAAARNYVESDRSRADDYYLAEGSGIATRYVASRTEAGASVRDAGGLDGAAYERWVAGCDVAGEAKGRLRRDDRALRFVEVVVNGPKSWSLAASLHPAVAEAYEAAQDRAVVEMVGWLAEHATTRVGPRGRQVQVPVEQIEAAVVRHYTSRAGDPHRHLHVQVNARVFAYGRWRGLHSVGVVDSIEALNGIGHAAVMCDPQFRGSLAAHGYTLAEDGEIRELAGFVGAFSQRAGQIGRHMDRFEAAWRAEHPGQEPGPRLRRSWDRRAWALARPDKVSPRDGVDLVAQWNEELHDLGYTPPTQSVGLVAVAVGRVDRDAVAELIVTRLGARRSAWNHADVRGETERLVAALGVVADAPVRSELVEDITSRAVEQSVRLLTRTDVPAHVRALTSWRVLAVEDDLERRFAVRAATPAQPVPLGATVCRQVLDDAQRAVVAAIAGHGGLVVVEGAAGSGKTTTLAAARELLEMQERRLMVVTPTRKAARVAEEQLRTPAHSAAWLAHQYGFRWDTNGAWTRLDAIPSPGARLLPGDMLLVDEAGMLDQDTASALLTIADETQARVVLLGDRHQLPAVGRGGVLDLAARWAGPEACVELDAVHRFADPDYAHLSLLMRNGQHSGGVFEALLERGEIVVHPSEVERTAALTRVEGLVIADTRDQVTTLNAAIRDYRHAHDQRPPHQAGERHCEASGEASSEPPSEPVDGNRGVVTTRRGQPIGIGDRVATRRNDRELGVANRDTWTVTGHDCHGGLLVTGRNGARRLPAAYVGEHVELAYATTVYGAQGETVDTAHFVFGESTSAAGAYVAMTRGRARNVAHLVADTTEDARRQWVEAFSRDRADLGPANAARLADDDVERYGPQAPHTSTLDPWLVVLHAAALRTPPPQPASPLSTATPQRQPGIGR
jgi:exodeoxyribonuclease V alpha subunit